MEAAGHQAYRSRWVLCAQISTTAAGPGSRRQLQTPDASAVLSVTGTRGAYSAWRRGNRRRSDGKSTEANCGTPWSYFVDRCSGLRGGGMVSFTDRIWKIQGPRLSGRPPRWKFAGLAQLASGIVERPQRRNGKVVFAHLKESVPPDNSDLILDAVVDDQKAKVSDGAAASPKMGIVLYINIEVEQLQKLIAQARST